MKYYTRHTGTFFPFVNFLFFFQYPLQWFSMVHRAITKGNYWLSTEWMFMDLQSVFLPLPTSLMDNTEFSWPIMSDSFLSKVNLYSDEVEQYKVHETQRWWSLHFLLEAIPVHLAKLLTEADRLDRICFALVVRPDCPLWLFSVME